jgi:ferrous iron transport protein A
LKDLAPGESARLADIGGDRSFRRRLMELGLLPGTRVRMVRRVDIGDLVEIEVRGSHLSLRLSEARAVLLEPEG